MKAIYLSTDRKALSHVYSQYIKSDTICYSQSDLGKVDLTDVEIIFSTWNMPVLTKEEILQYFPALKAIFYAAGTVKYFIEPYIELGIRVFNADKVNAIPVAEFTTAQIVLAAKGYFQSQRKYRKCRFSASRKIAVAHPGNFKTKIGVIGVGNIGKLVLKYLQPYDYEIFINDISLDKLAANKMGCRFASLEEIFKECDVISNHLPNTESTQNILNYNLFKLMKPNSTFINTARGNQVDDKGLRKALKEDKSRIALLDVLRHEPILPWNPLFGLSNVFITPHIAGSLNNEEKRMAEAMINAYDDFKKGISSDFEVNYDNLKNHA